MPTWVWVRDKSTGHRYDVAESAVDLDVHEVVGGYPENTGETAVPRPPKYAPPSTASPEPDEGQSATDDTEKE